jgi:hypothetical protein
MASNEQIDSIFNKIISNDWLNGETKSMNELIHSYEELNQKCDEIISKIKNRKSKKK